MSGPLGSSQWMYASGEAAPQQSLKFNDDESQYLSWTPAAAGNRKTFTLSMWFKLANLPTSDHYLFGTGVSGSATQSWIYFNSSNSNKLTFGIRVSSSNYQITIDPVYRDPSAWYHLTYSVDTTQSTASDRVKIYVNGSQVTDFVSSSYPPQNSDTSISDAVPQVLGANNAGSGSFFDGYLSNIHFIDGQALDATSFGKFTNGYWEKKDYAGSYGTNGFHLTFQDDVVSEGFNAVTYRGTGANQSISGLGLNPDLVWMKRRDTAVDHDLQDSVRGAGKTLMSQSAEAELNLSGSFGISSFDSDGFSIIGGGGRTNTSGGSYVAWCWDAGSGSPVSNTQGSITSTVKANPDYGFSIVSYTGNGTSGATVGHGLGIKPSLVILKNRSNAYNWIVFTNQIDGSIDNLKLNLIDAKTDTTRSDFTTSVFELSGGVDTNESGSGFIAYCFAEVAGYSSIGSYTGNGSTSGPTITTGFKPSMVIIKRTDATNNWIIQDTTRDAANPVDAHLYLNLNNTEDTGKGFDVSDTGFQIKFNGDGWNASGGTYLYYAVADTREAAFWKDVSGQGNHWQPNNLDYRDSLPDSPANNFATLNVLTKGTSNITLAEGNLKANAIASGSGSNWGTVFSSHTLPSTGKYYVEGLAFINAGVGNNSHLGILDTSSFQPAHNNSTYSYTTGEGFDGVYVSLFNNNARPVSDGVLGTAEGSLTDTTVLVMLAVDVDNGKVWAGYNGTWLNGGDPNAGTGEIATRTFTTNDAIAVGVAYGSTNAQGMIANFGQDSTFAGAKPMGAFTDDNSIGNFQYAPPAGYLALCTANLPDPTIVDGSEYFNTVLYTGNGSTTQTITGVGFDPDFVWIKNRTSVLDHNVYDVIRGDGKKLKPNKTDAETDVGTDFTFETDGFFVGNRTETNESGSAMVGWNWKAGGTAVSNTDGSITSQVSANTTAGFSIATYTGTGANASFGHGLGVAPDMVMVKRRDAVNGWIVFHKDLTSTHILILDSTTASFSSNQFSPNPSSSVVSILDQPATNASGGTYVAYSFANTEGYLKAGSYTGNGNNDGPFIFLGFRPAFFLTKRVDSTSDWQLLDTSRDTFNAASKYLKPNSNAAESTGGSHDFVSNGFKIRNSGGSQNANGGTYIYLAFAENPFKYANAR